MSEKSFDKISEQKKTNLFTRISNTITDFIVFAFKPKTCKTSQSYTMQTNDTTENNKPISDINIQHMTGEDKNIETYEQVVSNIFSYQSKSTNEVKEIGGNTITNTPTIQPISITHQKPIIQKEAIGHAPRTE
ncbi:MAG: hypothetical protein IKJ28_00495 [Alphaproteobacteria bacterium]|nr:hypothetical protein [Alphaproteobacteria bacterium]